MKLRSASVLIGSHKLSSNLILAPMAGITDLPFRQLCREMGAGLAVSEMLSSNPRVWNTPKSRSRMCNKGETGIKSVQIAGSDPKFMADAARLNVDNGAQIIDINMGCPAKKVNKKLAGSALLKEPALVEKILNSVVTAVDVPVTLKIRTGWDPQHKNGTQIAQIAEQSGIAAIAIHGRTRACLFKGNAEYQTIADIKKLINIPVIANGDIRNVRDAMHVAKVTNADGLMIGRGAQGKPWIFKQIARFLEDGSIMPEPDLRQQHSIIIRHLEGIHSLYGEVNGIRIARKHIGWYLQDKPLSLNVRKQFNSLETSSHQIEFIDEFFSTLAQMNYPFVA